MTALKWNSVCTKCDLTWTKQKCKNLFNFWMGAYVVSVPTEEHFLCQWDTCIMGKDMPFFKRNIPNIQVSDISKKGLCEIPSKRILILSQNEYPLPKNIPGNVHAQAHIFPFSIYIDSPVAIAVLPCNTDVMPSSIVGERCLVRLVPSMDDECQKDASLQVHLAS